MRFLVRFMPTDFLKCYTLGLKLFQTTVLNPEEDSATEKQEVLQNYHQVMY